MIQCSKLILKQTMRRKSAHYVKGQDVGKEESVKPAEDRVVFLLPSLPGYVLFAEARASRETGSAGPAEEAVGPGFNFADGKKGVPVLDNSGLPEMRGGGIDCITFLFCPLRFPRSPPHEEWVDNTHFLRHPLPFQCRVHLQACSGGI